MQALALLHKATGIFDIQDEMEKPAFKSLGLTPAEEDIVIERFSLQPNAKVDDNSSKAVQIMQRLPTLGRTVNKHTVKELQVWSNKYKDEYIPLSKLIDRDAKFTINNSVWTSRVELGLTDEQARDWYIDWNHIELSDYMSKIWPNNNNNKLYTDVITAIDKFSINLECKELHIMNKAGDQEMLGNLNNTLSLYDNTQYLPHKQKMLFDMIHKKLNKDNVYKKQMNLQFREKSTEYPSDTVADWIKCYLYVRSKARTNIDQTVMLGGKAPEWFADHAISKREKENNREKKTFRETEAPSKEQKRLEKYDSYKARYKEEEACNKCGWWSHKAANCNNTNPDRNQDADIPFTKSVKGKQWFKNRKLGPFVSNTHLLNGQLIKPTGTNTGTNIAAGICKYYRTLLSSINSDVNETEFLTWISRKTIVTSDFLNVYISLPISQMALETEKGKEERERKRLKFGSPKTDRGLRIFALALLDTGR